MQNTLTPTLNDIQLKQNIDAMQKQGLGNDQIQSYVDNYAKESDGNYNLKNQPTDDKNLLQKTGDVVQGIFPNQNIGKIIGTPLGGIYTAITNPKALKFYDWNPHANPAGVAADIGGDALNAALLLAAPETGGGSLATRMGINALAGGGLSLANSLSGGQSVTDQGVITNAAGSATLSSLLPVFGKMIGSVSNSSKLASGITPQVEKVLQDTNPQELKSYIQTVLAHNNDLNTPTATGVMASKLNDATDLITNKLKIAGQAVGTAIREKGAKIIGENPQTKTAFTDDVLSSFNKKLEDTFGHEVTVNPDNTSLKIAGETVRANPNTEPILSPLEGRSRTISPADQKRILTIHNYITDMADNPTIAKASDVVHNLDDLIDYSKVDKVGINHDPLQGIIRTTRGEINTAIRTASPEVAAANDRFSQLKSIENEIGKKAGGDMQRSALIMRRVFSGDQSGKSLQLLNDIKNETGVDLVKHAALAKFATDNFGDESSKSLLQQEINQGGSLVGGMKRALISPLKNVAKKLVVPDTEKFATKITQGGKYSGIIDELLNSPSGKGLLRTYANNVSAAHPAIGTGIDTSIQNLITNILNTKTSTPRR